ncbi:MAG: SelB C-terminal domain-containing protein [Pedococcus sp.]
MAVVATAGHVDHGKSTLVRLLTGKEPDRWAEERRRGLTIDLGYAWTDIDGRRVSLVDVPGHEHFTGNMLAGLGPVRAVMFVVAADDGWCPQSQEHARAIAALGIEYVLLVVTRCDLVSGEDAAHEARERFASLGVPVGETVLVSGATGAGVPDLRAALGRLAAAATPRATAAAEPTCTEAAHDDDTKAEGADTEIPVRLWVDRSFTIRGAGAVVTGTLEAGTLRVDDALLLRGRRVTIRGLQSCDEQVEALSGPARVAVNLRGLAASEVYRGDALLTESWPPPAALVDVTGPDVGARLPRELTLHVGTAALPVRTQRLPNGKVRLRLPRPVPLVPRDRAVLRDPGLHEVLAGVEVALVDPPTRHDRRRGEAPPARPAGPAQEAPDGIQALVGWLGAHPLQAPSRDQLDAWAFTSHDLASAAERGEVLRLGGVVVAGDALARAAAAIGQLTQPFTVGDAARAMGTSRRVAVPLLERLDASLVTRRLPDGSRELRDPDPQPDPRHDPGHDPEPDEDQARGITS